MAKVFIRMARPHQIYKEEGIDQEGKPYDIHLTGYDPVDGEPTRPVYEVELTVGLRAALNEGTSKDRESDKRLEEIRDPKEAERVTAQLLAEREQRLKERPIKTQATVTLTQEQYDRLLQSASAGRQKVPAAT